MADNFFTSLSGFRHFHDLTDESYFVTAPEDWTVVITDIEGSTEAIRQGKYKIVNMVGASTLAAVVNATGIWDLPYVFGGDGATALVPNIHLEKVKEALAKSRYLSRQQSGLQIRIGLVPHVDLVRAQQPVRVGKYILNDHCSLAFFKGKGLTLAESWVKSGKYLLDENHPQGSSDPHQGLSCRWAPVPNKQGLFMSLLIKIDDEKTAGEPDFVYRLLDEMDQILDFNSPDANPIKAESLKLESVLKATRLEGGFQNTLKFIKTFLFVLLVKALNQGWVRLKNFNMDQYKKSLSTNSDFRKFDETLRMVIDCKPQQKERLLQLLDTYHQKGYLFYGTHDSPNALMTCFVQDYRHHHVHFVDGGDGGYAMAAKGLKEQLKISQATSK